MNKRDQANIFDARGWLYQAQEKYFRAIECHKKSLELRQDGENRYEKAITLTCLAKAYLGIGRDFKAEELFENALKTFQEKEVQARPAEASCLEGLGLVYTKRFLETANGILSETSQSLFSKAKKYFEDALQIRKSTGETPAEAETLINMGKLIYSASNYKFSSSEGSINFHDQSLSYYEQALSSLHDIHHPDLKAKANQGLGNNYISLKEYEQAIRFFEASREFYKRIGSSRLVSEATQRIGYSYLALGDQEFQRHQYDLALEQYEKSKEGFLNLGDSASLKLVLSKIALASELKAFDLTEKSQCGKAIQKFEHCKGIYSQLSNLRKEKEISFKLALLRKILGEEEIKKLNYEAAIKNYEISKNLYVELNSPQKANEILLIIAQTYYLWGDGSREKKDYKDAIQKYQKSISLYSDLGRVEQEEDLLLKLAHAYDSLGRDDFDKGKFDSSVTSFLQVDSVLKQLGYDNFPDKNLQGEELRQVNLNNSYLENVKLKVRQQPDAKKILEKRLSLLSHTKNSLRLFYRQFFSLLFPVLFLSFLVILLPPLLRKSDSDGNSRSSPNSELKDLPNGLYLLKAKEGHLRSGLPQIAIKKFDDTYLGAASDQTGLMVCVRISFDESVNDAYVIEIFRRREDELIKNEPEDKTVISHKNYSFHPVSFDSPWHKLISRCSNSIS